MLGHQRIVIDDQYTWQHQLQLTNLRRVVACHEAPGRSGAVPQRVKYASISRCAIPGNSTGRFRYSPHRGHALGSFQNGTAAKSGALMINASQGSDSSSCSAVLPMKKRCKPLRETAPMASTSTFRSRVNAGSTCDGTPKATCTSLVLTAYAATIRCNSVTRSRRAASMARVSPKPML